MKKKVSTIIVFLLPVIFVFLLDIISKYYAEMYLRAPLHIIGDFFRFFYRENYGIAFSIPFKGPLLIISNIIILIFILFLGHYYLDFTKKTNLIAFGLLIGGALGNIFDRFTKGYVIDFIAIGSFPVFNIADSALTVGAVLLIWRILKTN